MDYIFATSLMAVWILTVVQTYDIACQFFAKLWERLKELPPQSIDW